MLPWIISCVKCKAEIGILTADNPKALRKLSDKAETLLTCAKSYIKESTKAEK